MGILMMRAEVGGISFISTEDIEQNSRWSDVAPNGYYQRPLTQYVHIGPDGQVVSKALDMPTPGPEPGIPIIAHGKPGYMLIVDFAGRKHWLGEGFARHLGGRLKDHEAMRTHLEAADGLEERGELHQAMNS
ncbi:hypothetical protein EDB80DRAFT_693614 [Ilyonectria destructans]|nr:hypothetical protein EDB80DRAFT_693614 [Ilyonectria destructans]